MRGIKKTNICYTISMQTHTFTYKEIFSPAWHKTKENAWYLFRVMLLAAVIMGAGRFFFVFSPIIDFFVGIAIITVSLVIAKGETPTFQDLFKSFKSYKISWHYFLSSLLAMLFVLIGLILLILPGIYLAVRLQFYKFLIVEHEDMGPYQAIEKSIDMTKGHFWKLFGFIVLIALLNILGAIALGVGLLVTIPVSILAHAYLYKKLSHTS